MIFSLDVRRARKGDCLLLHFGSKNEPGLVMIDGGPKSVYQPQLKPRLERIKAARRLTEQESLLVDLLMVSHVDDDHIQGILELTRRGNHGEAGSPAADVQCPELLAQQLRRDDRSRAGRVDRVCQEAVRRRPEPEAANYRTIGRREVEENPRSAMEVVIKRSRGPLKHRARISLAPGCRNAGVSTQLGSRR